jgi:hypothetical protein
MVIKPERRRRHVAAMLAAACAFAAVTATSGAAFARPSDMAPDMAVLTVWQRSVLLHATRQFRDVKNAIEAGYLPTTQCEPGMGLHYVKPSLAGDTNIDPTLPEILVYVPVAGEPVRLAALDYFRADADQDLKTDNDRPTLFGVPFNGPVAGHPLPPGLPTMPIHYDLHVWLYQTNPDGELATDNPKVDCK